VRQETRDGNRLWDETSDARREGRGLGRETSDARREVMSHVSRLTKGGGR